MDDPDPIPGLDPHAFVACTENHMFPMSPHCATCGESPSHPLHASLESA